jgi:hypothetical protein
MEAKLNKDSALKHPEAKAESKQLDKPYERTPYEQGVMQAYKAKQKEKPPAPSVKVVVGKDRKVTVEPVHPERGIAYHLIAEALGTTDYDFMNGLLTQLCNDVAQGEKIDEGRLNFMLSVVKGVEPRDQVEAMLAAQMAAVHNATMTFARRLAHVENIPQQDSAERAFNKLARTFAAQLEALKRYRSAGEQTVRVEHVTVNEGGQAIVGNVSHGGRGSPKKVETTS